MGTRASISFCISQRVARCCAPRACLAFALPSLPNKQAARGASPKLSSSLLRLRDVLNTEVFPVDKGLLMQKMALFVCAKQKGREPGGLGQSHRKQVPQSPRFGPVLQLVDKSTHTREGYTLLLPACVFLSFANVI